MHFLQPDMHFQQPDMHGFKKHELVDDEHCTTRSRYEKSPRRNVTKSVAVSQANWPRSLKNSEVCQCEICVFSTAVMIVPYPISLVCSEAHKARKLH